ncbi:MAG: ROK family transcriptional regulator [Eubacterium sp.]|nr:ROK family transcriptional regulator [Eubacterium sp.]
MTKGLNLRTLKNENISLILYLLNSRSALSRKELASLLGLTPAAVSKICSELIAEGFIEECGENEDTGRSGRREILLRLKLYDKLALCVNCEKDTVTLSVCDLSGALLEKKEVPLSDEPEEVIKAAKAFVNSFKGDKSKIVGAGICVIGTPDEYDFGVWNEPGLGERFETELGVPVTVENNVKAFAEGELIYGGTDKSDSVLFLKWGPGVGSAIAANGKVFSGNDSSVAEIGHYIVNAGGVKCRCGRFGCLETEVSEDVILKEINNKQTLDEVLNICDNYSMNIIEHKIDMVALALTNTATILNAGRVVLFGTMFTNEIMAKKLIKQCLRYNANLSEDMIKLSSLNAESHYIGAAAICAKAFFFEREKE